MGSELSVQSCVRDFPACSSPEQQDEQGEGRGYGVLLVKLQQPFGLTLRSETHEESVVKAVSECEAEGNAAAAGVTDGMILLQINGVDMQQVDLDTLSKFMSSLPPNKVVTLTFLSRGGGSCPTEKVKDSSTTDEANIKSSALQATSSSPDDSSTTTPPVLQPPPVSQPCREPLTTAGKVETTADTLIEKSHTVKVDHVPVAVVSVATETYTPENVTSEKEMSVETPVINESKVEEPDHHATASCVAEGGADIPVLQTFEHRAETGAVQQECMTLDVATSSSELKRSQDESLETSRIESEVDVVDTSAESTTPPTSQYSEQDTLQQVALILEEATLRVHEEADRKFARGSTEMTEIQGTTTTPPEGTVDVVVGSKLDENEVVLSAGEKRDDDGTVIDVIATDEDSLTSSQDNEQIQDSTCDSHIAAPTRVVHSFSEAISSSCSVMFSADIKIKLSECISMLQNGIQVKKHNRSVAPSDKWLHVDLQMEKLYWRNEMDSGLKRKNKSSKKLFGKSDSDREVSFEDIIEVRNDCSSAVMKRSKSKKFIDTKAKSCHVLSLILTDNKTLNFEVKEENWELLYYLMGHLVEFVKQRRQQTDQP